MPARSDGVRGALCRAHRWLGGTVPEPGPQVMLRLAGRRLAAAALDGGTAPVPAAGPDPGPAAGPDPGPAAGPAEPAGLKPIRPAGTAGPHPGPRPGHPDPLALLCADPAALRAAADAVAGNSAFRAAPGVEMAQHDMLAVAVAAAVLAVRAMDLRALAGVLRAAAFLGVDTSRGDACSADATRGGLDWAVAHLVAQQQPDGGYGTGSDDRVALTVDCVWTLGELLAPGFTGRCRAAHQEGEPALRCDAVGMDPYPADLVVSRSRASS